MKKTTMDEGRAVPIRPLFKALAVSHLLCDLGMIAVPLCASLCLPLPSDDWTGNDLPGPFHLCDRYAFRGSLLLDLFSQTNANMFFSVIPSLISSSSQKDYGNHRQLPANCYYTQSVLPLKPRIGQVPFSEILFHLPSGAWNWEFLFPPKGQASGSGELRREPQRTRGRGPSGQSRLCAAERWSEQASSASAAGQAWSELVSRVILWLVLSPLIF